MVKGCYLLVKALIHMMSIVSRVMKFFVKEKKSDEGRNAGKAYVGSGSLVALLKYSAGKPRRSSQYCHLNLSFSAHEYRYRYRQRQNPTKGRLMEYVHVRPFSRALNATIHHIALYSYSMHA
eukprot:scaffold3171_cov84-Skeletonema_dohrnii-CCMP3373.AAC.3